MAPILSRPQCVNLTLHVPVSYIHTVLFLTITVAADVLAPILKNHDDYWWLQNHVTGLCAGNSPGTGDFPAQMASDAENVSI